jgi:predicted small secreted protein
MAEKKQAFEELQALEPVDKEKIPEGIKPLGCHLFMVEKFDASGRHKKYKSRLVSHGNEQDTSLYPDRSSPTVSVHVILMCLALAACNTAYTLGKIDVKGAFIQTEMSGTPVYIKCTRQLRDLILDLFPEYNKYIGKDGVLYCKLFKALYGCVQASKLWYEKVCKFLERLGYVQGEVDPCVFRRVVGEKVYLLTLYVDDILLIAERVEIERMEKAFVAAFQWITMAVGSSHLYIGMKLTVDRGYVVFDMRYYLKNFLEPFDNPQVKVVPGNKETFMVKEAAEKLDLKKRMLFHSSVAKLLYLSKRAHPDIIAVVGFLCTRVKEPSIKDWEKMGKLLGYLKGTEDFVMRLKPNALFRVVAYIDASFSAHPDGKSHSGIVVKVGGAPIFFGSKKQKCISKSPTEAELVALSDNVGFVELFAEFVAFVTNSEQMKPLIYQDSASVITMVTEGGGVTRTKTMRTRMNLVLEAVKEDRIEVRYVNTKGMEADGLSKSLGGGSFLEFRGKVLNLSK